MNKKVILSYGLGVDSTAILHRWLTRPQCRDFDLKDLLVITAMTGDEFPDTGQLVETHILPLLRKHKIRYIQVARGGLLKEAGYVILSDTDKPDKVYLKGAFKLSEELLLAGTVPQIANGRRWCSQKFKGEPIDWVIANEMKGQPFIHVIGFNADEERRVAKDQVYGGDFEGREARYPLLEWGWGRTACEAYLRHTLGEFFVKSCCSECPFTRGQDHILARFRTFPEAAARALFMEHLSLALNPAMRLYGTKSLYQVLTADKNAEAMNAFQKLLEATEWAFYRVRRIQWAKTAVWRKIERLTTGTRPEMVSELSNYCGPVESNDHGIYRYQSHARGKTFPTTEEALVVAPVGVADKCRGRFDIQWKKLRGQKLAVAL